MLHVYQAESYSNTRKMWLLPLYQQLFVICMHLVWLNWSSKTLVIFFVCFSLRSWMWNKCRSRKTTWNGKEVIGCWTAGRRFVSLSCGYRYVPQENDSCTDIPLGEVVFFHTVCFLKYPAFLQIAFYKSQTLGHLYAAVLTGATRDAVEYLCFGFDKRKC